MSITSDLVAQGFRFTAGYPPGSARARDYMWPDPAQISSGNPNAVVVVKGAANAGLNAPGLTTQGFAGGNTNVSALWNGVTCCGIVSGPAATQGTGMYMDGFGSILLKTQSPCFIPPSADDTHCWRVVFNMAGQHLPSLNADYGCYVTRRDTGGQVVSNAGTGFGFCYRNDGQVMLVARGPQGFQSVVITSGAFDFTQWHSFELVMQGATATDVAKMAVYMDGQQLSVPVGFTSWAAATTYLPSNLFFASVRSGFAASAVNTSGLTNNLFLQQMRVISGPTVLSLY